MIVNLNQKWNNPKNFEKKRKNPKNSGIKRSRTESHIRVKQKNIRSLQRMFLWVYRFVHVLLFQDAVMLGVHGFVLCMMHVFIEHYRLNIMLKTNVWENVIFHSYDVGPILDQFPSKIEGICLTCIVIRDGNNLAFITIVEYQIIQMSCKTIFFM